MRPLFLGMSIVLIALGMGYLGVGAVGVMHHQPRAAVLAGLGAAAAVVGMVVWRLVRRMSNQQ